jgi:predicted RNA-binding Zn ribbon-like protein
MIDNSMPAFFIADDMGLDFLNSIATPVDTPVEWLDSGEALLRWIEQADLVPSEILTSFKNNAIPGELDTVAAQARMLREWFRGFVLAHKGKPLRSKAIEELGPLNQLLARDEEFGQIVPRKTARGESQATGLEWRRQRRWRSSDTLLLPIAHTLASLFCTANFTYVKQCENPACSLLFVDRTNRHTRRWCSMATCGNRAKQAAHRARLQKEKD